MRGLLNRNSLRRKLPVTVVDLWFATLADNDFSLQQVLSPDETRRALRFRFDRGCGHVCGAAWNLATDPGEVHGIAAIPAVIYLQSLWNAGF